MSVRQLQNVEFDLLRFVAAQRISGVTTIEAVRAKYRTSKQPLKKSLTYYRKLRRLVRQGLVRECPCSDKSARYTQARFIITPEGLAAGREHQERDNGLRVRATFPRLAR